MTNTQEIIKLGQIEVRYLQEGKETNGKVAMFEFKVPVGAKVPIPHYHENFDETGYGLEGIITYTVDGKVFDLKPGESYFIPRGAVHGFNNLGTADTKTLAVITPGIMDPDFFRECGIIINAGGPPDMAKLKAVYQKHGLVPAILPL